MFAPPIGANIALFALTNLTLNY